jgi:hypothetical protein
LLAFEQDEVNRSKKVLEEAKDTFGTKQSHFDGHERTYHPDSADGDMIDNEYKEVVTTVKQKVDYVSKMLIKSINVVLSKEETNASGAAHADLIVGEENFGSLSATALLYLEKSLAEIRRIYEGLPTLVPGKSWHYNTDLQLYETEQTVTYRNIKEIVPLMLAPATDKHPAQVKETSQTKKVGEYHETHRSGRIFPKVKSEVLDRIDSLIKAVKLTRERANTAEVKEIKLAEQLFNYINEPLRR